MLADEPGFRSLGSVKDRAGREGTAIGFVDVDHSPDYLDILIVSTEAGQLLGTEAVITKDQTEPDVKAPAVSSFTTITRSEWLPNNQDAP